MSNDHHTPGMYLDETSLLPKSVVQIETAVPAFIGYTEKAIFDGLNLHALNKIQPLEINSFEEYEAVFGKAPEPVSAEIHLDNTHSIVSIRTEEFSFLYYSVKLFFENGGSSCLIVSVGNYTAAAGKVLQHQLLAGLASLEKTDAPTLLVMPDATKLTYAEAGEVHAAMLAQAGKHKNRFVLLDLVNGNSIPASGERPVDQFRFHLGMNNLSFGAAYYPWLVTAYFRKAGSKTVLAVKYHINGKRIDDLAELFRHETIDVLKNSGLFSGERISLKKSAARQADQKKNSEALAEALYIYLKEFYNLNNNPDVSNYFHPGTAIHKKYIAEGSAFHNLLKRLQVTLSIYHRSLPSGNFGIDFSPLIFSPRPVFVVERGRARPLSFVGSLKSIAKEAERLVNGFYKELETMECNLQENLKQSDPVYKSVVNAIETQNIIIPPGGAVAGLISKVDRERGVWKAPANVSLTSVVFPAVEVSQNDQENLNVDAIAGKSINAVRAFTGKGIMVWGARTLAGNDNEWRYVNVRRFCMMVEQSVGEAIRPFLFERNDAATWQRVKIMVTNFLFSLWTQGALQGIKPEHAFFLKIGLGETMTALDIESGMMNLQIGLAVLKPAEFIILEISNKMQIN